MLLETEYIPSEERNKKKDEGEIKFKLHPIEDATVHYVVKKILEKEKNSLSK